MFIINVTYLQIITISTILTRTNNVGSWDVYFHKADLNKGNTSLYLSYLNVISVCERNFKLLFFHDDISLFFTSTAVFLL